MQASFGRLVFLSYEIEDRLGVYYCLEIYSPSEKFLRKIIHHHGEVKAENKGLDLGCHDGAGYTFASVVTVMNEVALAHSI